MNGTKYSKTRPTLEQMGVAADAKKFFRVVSMGNCQWAVVSKKGEPGTMRQTIRQRSGKIMRESGVGRKTVAIKNRVAFRCESTEEQRRMRKAAEFLNMSNAEAFNAFGGEED